MAYTIRKATITDCNELSYLKHKMWETTYRGIYPDDRIDKYDYEKNKYKFLKIINLGAFSLFYLSFVLPPSIPSWGISVYFIILHFFIFCKLCSLFFNTFHPFRYPYHVNYHIHNLLALGYLLLNFQ